MDFKNTLTAYNEHVAQIEEAKKIMMNAPAEVFGKYYHDFDFGMAKDSVVTDYLEWKMKQGNLTFEVLKEKWRPCFLSGSTTVALSKVRTVLSCCTVISRSSAAFLKLTPALKRKSLTLKPMRVSMASQR